MSIEKLKNLPKQYLEYKGKSLLDTNTLKFYIGKGEVANNDKMSLLLELYFYCYQDAKEIKLEEFIKEYKEAYKEASKQELGEVDQELLNKFIKVPNRVKYCFPTLMGISTKNSPRKLFTVCNYNAIKFAEFNYNKTGKWPDRDVLLSSIKENAKTKIDSGSWTISNRAAEDKGLSLRTIKAKIDFSNLIGEAPILEEEEADL